MGKAGERGGRLGDVRSFLGELYGPDLHAKRIDALAGATLGVMAAASLAVAMIGQALAQARGLVTKHAVKQVDRLLSNSGIDVWDSFARWVPHQMNGRSVALVAMDWTDFDHDGQSTLVLSLVTGHGRAAPLLWLSVWKEEIATRRNDYEDACLRRLAELVPSRCRVTILADRGFGDQKLFAFLGEAWDPAVLHFDEVPHDASERYQRFTAERRSAGRESTAIYRSRVGVGRSKLDPVLRGLLRATSGGLLRDLGYLGDAR